MKKIKANISHIACFYLKNKLVLQKKYTKYEKTRPTKPQFSAQQLNSSTAQQLNSSTIVKNGLLLLFLIFFPKITPLLVAQTDLDYEEQGFPTNYDSIFWADTNMNEYFGDSCAASVNIVPSLVRFDQESIVELNFTNGYQPTNLTMTLSSGVGATLYPDSISGNKVMFDHLENDQQYTLKGNDHCSTNVEIARINTSAVGSKEDVVIVSENMMAALRDFHQQDTTNAQNLVEFLVSYPALSRLETLSYLQNILRNGTPTDRDYYDSTDTIVYDSFALLIGLFDDTDPDPDPDPDPDDPWDPERYCTCRIAQSNVQFAFPGKRVVNENRIEPLQVVEENGMGGWWPFYFTVYEKGYQALGPARLSRNFRRGIYQAERNNEILSNMDTSQVINNPAYYAVLDYTLNCVSNPFGKPGRFNVCDCIREGSLDWSYDAVLRIDNSTFPAPFWDSYATGYLQEMAYVLKIEGDEDFEVLDVGMTELASSCNATVDRDFLVDLLMIQTSMGLAVLNNLTPGSDSTDASIDWADAAEEIADQISNLISQDSVLINTCDTIGIIQRRLLDSSTAGDKKSFILTMGKRLKIILASGFHSSISTKGTSSIDLVTNTAFRLGGIVSGGVPKDTYYRDDPRTYRTCCGQYSGNYVFGNVIPPEDAELSVVRSDTVLRNELGLFFGPGSWQDSNGNPIPSTAGITDLPENNYGLLLSGDETIVDCELPFIIKKPKFTGNLMNEFVIDKNEPLKEVLKRLEGNASLEVSLFSISGKLINKFSFINYSETLSYLENLPSGLYILNFKAGNQLYNYKIMKP